MKTINYLLCLFGLASLVTIVIIFIMFLLMELRYLLGDAKIKHKYKHRFDKPPTAKCYCRDCRYWDSGKCDKFREWRTADCWFCWNAEPKDKEDSFV